jgi:hypothetical protein
MAWRITGAQNLALRKPRTQLGFGWRAEQESGRENPQRLSLPRIRICAAKQRILPNACFAEV